ncbi:MAG: tetratricopeptide repeat protein [Acidobacteriota bacterium]
MRRSQTVLCPLLSRQQLDPDTGKSEWTHLECLGAQCMFYNVPEANCQFLLTSRNGQVNLPAVADGALSLLEAGQDGPGTSPVAQALAPLLEPLQEGFKKLKERFDSRTKEAEKRLRRLEKVSERLGPLCDAVEGLLKCSPVDALEEKLDKLRAQLDGLLESRGDEASLSTLREALERMEASAQHGDSSAMLAQISSRLEAMVERQTQLVECLQQSKALDAEAREEGAAASTTALEERLREFDRSQQEILRTLQAFRDTVSALPSRHEEIVERISSTIEEALQGQTDTVGGRLADELKAFAKEQAERLDTLAEDAVRNHGHTLQAMKKAHEEQKSSIAAMAPRLEQVEGAAQSSRQELERLCGGVADLRARLENGPEALKGLESQLQDLQSASRAAGDSARQSVDKISSQVETVGRSLGQMALVIKALQGEVERANSNLAAVRTENKSLVLAFHEQKTANQEEQKRRKTEQARELNNKGVALFHRGSLEAAIEAFIRSVELKPDFAEAYNNLGLAYSKRRQSDESVRYFQKALEIDPQMGEVYNNLGFLFHTSARYDRAVEMFNHSLQAGADQAIAYTNLGNTYYQMKQNDKAVAAWGKALEIDPLNETAKRGLSMFHQEAPAPASGRS